MLVEGSATTAIMNRVGIVRRTFAFVLLRCQRSNCNDGDKKDCSRKTHIVDGWVRTTGTANESEERYTCKPYVRAKGLSTRHKGVRLAKVPPKSKNASSMRSSYAESAKTKSKIISYISSFFCAIPSHCPVW